MSFADDINRFTVKVVAESREIFVNSASHALDSIKNGSPVTGAPGQPVRDSILKNSWQLQFLSETEAEISTNVAWAKSNEDGIARPGGGPYIQRSPVGGRHSVKLTIVGLPKIVAHETAKVTGGAR